MAKVFKAVKSVLSCDPTRVSTLMRLLSLEQLSRALSYLVALATFIFSTPPHSSLVLRPFVVL